MRAVVIEEFGGPEVLQVAEVPVPSAGPGQVRIRVHAAGVNPLDWKIRSGNSPFPVAFPFTPGLEAAGVVDELGAGVTGVTVGDSVFGLANAGNAEFAVLTAYAAKPAGMPWELAATLPQAAETASRTLKELGVSSGQTILIGSAAGAVGSIAIQLAVRLGARVIGTAGPADQEFLAGLGAVATTYGDGLVERVRALAPEGVDLALDCGGFGALPDMIELTGDAAGVLTIADPRAFELGVTFSNGAAGADVAAIPAIAELYEEGGIKFRVGPAFALTEVAQAHQVSAAGGSRGKPVLVLAD